jgi:tetratricopeptide (TPR) repeat protein
MSAEKREQALALLEQAYGAQMEGQLGRAVELYKQSLEACPTAEAHTFIGWTYHFQGKAEDAIAECKRARSKSIPISAIPTTISARI